MSPILAVVIILALVIIAVLGSGWLIKSKIRFPSKLQLKILSSQELEEQISSALDEYEPELNQLGFEKIGDFEIIGASGQNLHRVYFHPDGEVIAMVSFFASESRKKPALVFYTRFQDQSSLSTDQALVPNFLEIPPDQELQRFAGVSSAQTLLQLHKKRLEELKEKGKIPVRLAKNEIFYEIEKDQQRLLEHQIKTGMVKKDELEEVLIPTWKFAFYFLLKIIDPIPFGVSYLRFFSSLFLASALIMGFSWLARWDFFLDLLAQTNLSPERIRFLIAGSGTCISGILLGYLIHRRGFLWAGVVSFLGVLILSSQIPNSWILIILGAQAGQVGSRLYESRISRIPVRLAGPILILIFLFVIAWMFLEK